MSDSLNNILKLVGSVSCAAAVAAIGGPAGVWLGGISAQLLGSDLVKDSVEKSLGVMFGKSFEVMFGKPFEDRAKKHLEALLGDQSPRNQDLQRALAASLVLVLESECKELREQKGTAISPFSVKELPKQQEILFDLWLKKLRKALTDEETLEGLFVGKATRDEIFQAAVQEGNDGAEWQFAEQALTEWSDGQTIPDDLRSHLHEHLPQKLPRAWDEVLRNPDYQRAWIAFQQTVVAQTIKLLHTLQTQLTGLTEEQRQGFAEVLKHLDRLEERVPGLLEQLKQGQSDIIKKLSAMEETFQRAQQPSEEQIHHMQAEIDRLRAEQSAADQRRRESPRKRIEGLVPDAVVQHFKDRDPERRSLRKLLMDRDMRLVFVCGPGGRGKTALVAKLIHELRDDNFILQSDGAKCEIESVVYAVMSQPESSSPDKIVDLICRTLEPESAQELRAKWQEKTSLDDKLEFLFRCTLEGRRCLIVLDNFESIMDQENSIRTEFADLGKMIEKCLEYDHSACIVATSRRPLILEPELEGRVGSRRGEIPLDKGLPEDEVVELLRELDTSDGRLGIKEAGDSTLRTVARRCGCIPRTLETLVGYLSSPRRRTWTLARLLENKDEFALLVEKPAQELYNSLSPEERLVLQALAVYSSPVPATAVLSLLPGLGVNEILDTLVCNYVVTYDRDLFSLHPLDQEYAYRRIPDASEAYTKSTLHARAAEFFHGLHKPREEWKAFHNLTPQIQEFHHLTRAGLFNEACSVLNEIDYSHLNLWGYYTFIVDLRSQLIGRLTNRKLEGINLGSLDIAYSKLGEQKRAVEYYGQALVIAREIGDKMSESHILLGLGNVYYDLENLSDFRRCYEEAFRLDNPPNNYDCAFKLGILCLKENKKEEARDYFTRSITLCRALLEKTPNLYDPTYKLALAQLGSGQSEEALTTYRQALGVCSAKGVVQSELWDLRLLQRVSPNLGGLAEACALLEDCLNLDS